MKKTDVSLKLLMNLAKVQSLMARRFDSLSAHGLSFSDFMIMYLLNQAPGEKMRRTDLAERIGLTSSGVTRMLVPMEKIGLVRREANERDARVSYVVLTDSGRVIFEEALVTAVLKAKEIIPPASVKEFSALADMLAGLGGDIV